MEKFFQQPVAKLGGTVSAKAASGNLAISEERGVWGFSESSVRVCAKDADVRVLCLCVIDKSPSVLLMQRLA